MAENDTLEAMKKLRLDRKKYLSIGIIMLIIFAAFLFMLLTDTNDRYQSASISSLPSITTTTTKPEVDPSVYELSLLKIFVEKPVLVDISKEELVTIVVTGDIIPGRHVNAKVVGYGNFNYPYLKTAEYLKDADLTVTNLESPFVTGCPVTSEGMTFCGDPRHVQGLVFAGIDIASLANNHSGNYGQKGITETQQLLAANNISPVGLGRIAQKEIKGTKFAFLAYNGVGQQFDLVSIKSDIEKAKQEADVVVVLPHWGKEYVRKPAATPGVAPDDPKLIAEKLIDYGADLVLGNHPHWYQGVEIYKNKLIAYAHGNFIFDQEWSVETTQGVVGKYTFYKGKLIDVTYRPIQIRDYSQPFFLDQNASDAILKIMKDNSWED